MIYDRVLRRKRRPWFLFDIIVLLVLFPLLDATPMQDDILDNKNNNNNNNNLVTVSCSFDINSNVSKDPHGLEIVGKALQLYVSRVTSGLAKESPIQTMLRQRRHSVILDSGSVRIHGLVPCPNDECLTVMATYNIFVYDGDLKAIEKAYTDVTENGIGLLTEYIKEIYDNGFDTVRSHPIGEGNPLSDVRSLIEVVTEWDPDGGDFFTGGKFSVEQKDPETVPASGQAESVSGPAPAPVPQPQVTGSESAQVPASEPAQVPGPEPAQVPGPEPAEVPVQEPAQVSQPEPASGVLSVSSPQQQPGAGQQADGPSDAVVPQQSGSPPAPNPVPAQTSAATSASVPAEQPVQVPVPSLAPAPQPIPEPVPQPTLGQGLAGDQPPSSIVALQTPPPTTFLQGFSAKFNPSGDDEEGNLYRFTWYPTISAIAVGCFVGCLVFGKWCKIQYCQKEDDFDVEEDEKEEDYEHSTDGESEATNSASSADKKQQQQQQQQQQQPEEVPSYRKSTLEPLTEEVEEEEESHDGHTTDYSEGRTITDYDSYSDRGMIVSESDDERSIIFEE